MGKIIFGLTVCGWLFVAMFLGTAAFFYFFEHTKWLAYLYVGGAFFQVLSTREVINRHRKDDQE